MSYINNIPNTIILYVSNQLNVDPNVFEFNRQNTIFEHFKDIKNIYGYKPFFEENYSAISKFLSTKYYQSDNSYFLIISCIEKLKGMKIILPGISKIEEIVSEIKVKSEENLLSIINSDITDSQRVKIAELLETPGLTSITPLAWLRDNNGSSTVEELLDTIKKLEKIKEINIKVDLKVIPYYKIESYVKLGRRYEPFSFRRFDDPKRYAILAVFLQDLRQTLIDRVITINDIRINSIFSRIKTIQDKNIKKHKQTIKETINDYVSFGNTILKAKNENKEIDEIMETLITWDKFKESVEKAEKLFNNTNKNSFNLLNNYYGDLRKYTPVLLKGLEFQNTTNSYKELMEALSIIKDLNESKKIDLPDDIEVNFTNKKWRKIIENKSGPEKRHYYEISVLNEMKNKIRSGDISVLGSKSFKDFEEYLVSNADWAQERSQTKLTTNLSVEEYLRAKEEKLNTLLKWYSKNHESLKEIIGEDEKIHLKRLEKNTPEESKRLSSALYKMVPKISLPDLLLEISKTTNFHNHFLHAANQQPVESFHDITVLIFAIMGLGTNVGLSKISESLNNISYKQPAHTADWKILEDNVIHAQASMVNYQLKEPLAKFWGNGTTSSSDGMRVKTTVNALNTSYNPHFGYDKGITIYRFVDDKYSAFYSTTTNTNNRDSLHVIDGLLKHKSELQIKEHYTDTAGYTDQVFALMSLMGFHFAPRLSNLTDLKLFSFDKNKFPKFNNLISGLINTDLIKTNYDNVLRLSHSIFEGKVSSALILGKLGSYSRNNTLANALKEMGRIEKTIFILEYASDPELRRRIQI